MSVLDSLCSALWAAGGRLGCRAGRCSRFHGVSDRLRRVHLCAWSDSALCTVAWLP